MVTGLLNSRRLDELDTRHAICSVQTCFNGDYIDAGDFICTAFVEKNSDNINLIKVKLGDEKIVVGDKIIIDRTVYIVEDVDENVFAVKKDEIESGLLKFQDMGVTIEKGIKIPVNQVLTPEDMHFVDQWIAVWTRNIAENYSIIKKSKSIKSLKDVCKGATAVIVGAGPSLDKNIDELKNINALIVATDRAYKPLLARGIEPDLVVSVDCHDDLILSYLDKVDSSKYVLILNSASDYQIARNWKGQILYFNMGHAGIQFCDRVLPFLFPNFMAVANVGCVVNTALIMANWIGCKSLILTGCDFSYPNEKMSCDTYDWSEGMFKKIEVDEKTKFANRSGKVKKNGIFTYPPFIDYEKTMKVLETTQKLEIVNATEGGIIDSFPSMSLKEAKEKFCKDDIKEFRDKLKGGLI
jgi:hypothetical protein